MPALRNAQPCPALHTNRTAHSRQAGIALNILALETSSAWCSVALWRDGALLDLEEHAGQTHSERLLPMVDTLLAQAGLTVRALDAIAFGEGPGSFTGLRIACGVAQGLAAGAGIITVGVGTLLAIAEASGGNAVLAALDARMGEVYCAAYQRDSSGWNVVHPPLLCTPDAAPPLPEGNWLGAGSAFAAHPHALATRYAGRIIEVQPELRPQARAIAVLGAALALTGHGRAPEDAHPLYLRDRVALTVAERRAKAGASVAEDER
jgi:tRNA threonylcarbamoyladenosine biosynthesis protein TsaB